MLFNSDTCAFCNHKKPTVLLGLDGHIPELISKQGKHDKTEKGLVQKLDRESRYLCFDCILKQMPMAKQGKFKALSGKTPIKIPKSSTILFFQGKVHVNASLIWEPEHKQYIAWLEPGQYQFIRIDAQVKRKRTKPDKNLTPLFGDMDFGMSGFNKAQGHAA